MANKTIALVAHDNRKREFIQWVSFNCHTLSQFNLVCTGTTGSLVEEEMQKSIQNFRVNLLKSGPMGGDLQMGSLIANGEIDFMIFLWDPMSSQPHDVDVKALLRVAVVYNIPMACNRSTADFIISSPLIQKDYKPTLKDYSAYLNRDIG